MNVVVTGGLGFIGSVVVEQFTKQLGVEVSVVDDGRAPSVGFDELPGARRYLAIPAANAAELLGSPTLPADLVVHCASPVGAVGVLDQYGKIGEQIVGTTAALAEGCLRSGARLINLSTSEAYGFSGDYQESDDCIVPARRNARMEYGAAKLVAEFAVTGAVSRGLRAITIRPFNVAGARQDNEKGFVLPTFVGRALLGLPLPVFGTGEQERAFTAVGDLADFIVGTHLAEADWQGEVYNVGNPINRVPIRVLARRVIELTGSESSIEYTTGREFFGRPDYEEALGHIKTPIIDEARSLGWQPRTNLDDLIRSVIADLQ